jgi:hypothetical protein
MNRKTLGAGILTLALPALLLSAASVGANAEPSTVTSEVTAIDACEWKLTGFPTQVVMRSSEGALYKGEKLEVLFSDASTILGLSGGADPDSATSGASVDCSFYNNILLDGVSVKIDGLLFSASWTNADSEAVVDTDMNFSLVETTNELSVAVTESCDEAFTAENAGFYEVTELDILSTASIDNLNVAGSNVRCAFELGFSVDIPASSKVPAGAGYGYGFTGPNLTFSNTLN